MTKRVAVVGCGHLGAIHARLLAARSDVRLVAVADPVAECRERISAAHGCRAVATPGELVGQVDAVVVAAPTGLHAEVVIPLVESGVDVLVEKPIAAAVEDARAIVIAARRHGRVVAVGHVERFNPAWLAVTERVDGVVRIEAERRAPFTFRSLDVGVVHDLMIHDIDLVLSLEPGRLERVDAQALYATGGHEDAARARLVFSSGLVADLAASRISPTTRRALSLWSHGAVATVDFNAKTVEIVGTSSAVRDGSFVAHRVPVAERAGLKDSFFTDILPTETVTVPDGNAIAAEHDDFLDAVRTRRSPVVPATAGAAALEIAARVIEAIDGTRLGGGADHPAVAGTVPLMPRRKTG